MTSCGSSTPDQLLLRDLVDGLSVPGREPALSVGILGSDKHAPHPPAHCLRACLDGDSNAIELRGCPFLVSAARNDIDTTSLCSGRCPKGFDVAAQHTTIGGAPAVLLTVEGQSAPDAPDADRGKLLRHLDSAARLVGDVGRLLDENAGFADEVLRNYEQLSLIFDLTQQITQVTETPTIEKLLLQRVAHLVGAPGICIVASDGEWRTYDSADTGQQTPAPATFSAAQAAGLVELVRRTRQAQAATIEGSQVIAGPLLRLDDRVDVVIARCPAERAPLTAGDALVVESVLTFGGQIISNSELNERLRQMSLEATRALVAAIDKKDHYTSGHSERVGFLTRLIAQEYGLRPAELQIMEWAGLLHDIGKIGIPEDILCKPGKLTTEEFEVIKQHPRMSYEILKPIASFELGLDGVLYHHEQPDGGGYPKGLAGDDVPLVARLIHVADTFDALTSTRSYRRAFTLDKAMDIIRDERGVRIDRRATDRFFQAFHDYRQNQPDDFAARFPALRAAPPGDPDASGPAPPNPAEIHNADS